MSALVKSENQHGRMLTRCERARLQVMDGFVRLPALTRHELLCRARVFSVASGEVIEAAEAGGWLLCLEGRVCLSDGRAYPDGPVLDSWGIGVWWSRSLPLPATLTAWGHTTVLYWGAEDVAVLQNHPALAQAVMQSLEQHVHRLMQRAHDLQTLSLRQRLARLLLELADWGKERTQEAQVTLRLTQQELARLLGASRQRINEQLKQWERQQMVQVATSRLVLRNLNQLCEVAA